MARATKTKSASEPAPVSAPVSVSTPVVESAPVKKVVKSKAKVEEPVPVVEVSAPVETTPEVDSCDVEVALNSASMEFLSKLNSISAAISSLKNEYRVLEKKWSKELKTALKACSKKRKKSGNRAPSGFVKPTRISDELANFLSKPIGTEMARTDVTREINNYIRTHKLQDKDNGRKIIPDSSLSSLLKLTTADELTYFNLQKYMSPHFAKSVKTEVASLVA